MNAFFKLFAFGHWLLRKRTHGDHIVLDTIAVILKKGLPAEIKDAKDAFFYDALIHFRDPELAVFENNRHFLYFKAQLPGGKFHFNLKSIPNEADLIEIDRFQHFLAVTDKTCGRILHLHPGDQAGIKGTAPGE